MFSGGLVHNVGELYAFDWFESTEIGSLLCHPSYGVHPVTEPGLTVEPAHVVRSHSYRTAVGPATLWAEIVRPADGVAAAAIGTRALDGLRDA